MKRTYITDLGVLLNTTNIKTRLDELCRYLCMKFSNDSCFTILDLTISRCKTCNFRTYNCELALLSHVLVNSTLMPVLGFVGKHEDLGASSSI